MPVLHRATDTSPCRGIPGTNSLSSRWAACPSSEVQAERKSRVVGAHEACPRGSGHVRPASCFHQWFARRGRLSECPVAGPSSVRCGCADRCARRAQCGGEDAIVAQAFPSDAIHRRLRNDAAERARHGKAGVGDDQQHVRGARGGTTRGGHLGFDCKAPSSIMPPNCGSGGSCSPLRVVVALGEPGAPVVVRALASVIESPISDSAEMVRAIVFMTSPPFMVSTSRADAGDELRTDAKLTSTSGPKHGSRA